MNSEEYLYKNYALPEMPESGKRGHSFKKERRRNKDKGLRAHRGNRRQSNY